MKTIQIFVEGVADVKFLSDYIQTILPTSSLPHPKDISDIVCRDTNIRIIETGGWQSVVNKQTDFERNTNDGGINLIIFDADKPDNDGGYEKRRQQIEMLMAGIDYQLFLLPNNQDSGDLEEVLEHVIADSNKPIFDCWSSFEYCLTTNASKTMERKLMLPAKKSKIHMYLEVLLNNSEKELAKEKNRNYRNLDHWNLDNEYLTPLKNFLKQNLV
jgi:hypothetical protein